jgi:hypothetical protein
VFLDEHSSLTAPSFDAIALIGLRRLLESPAFASSWSRLNGRGAQHLEVVTENSNLNI